MQRRLFLARSGMLSAGLALGGAAHAGAARVPSAVITLNGALTSAIAATVTGPTVAARALSMVYEAVYNAWAAYGNLAAFTLSGIARRPAAEWTQTSLKTLALANAAHVVMSNLFPTQQAAFDAALAAIVQGLPATGGDAAAALFGRGVGTALLDSRLNDGSNQAGGYADTGNYAPVNTADVLVDPNRWQPLRVTSADGVTTVQKYLTPHWGTVRPFALAGGSALRPQMGDIAPTMAEMNQLIQFSAALDDSDKLQVELFANNPGSVTPPGQWTKIAEMVSAEDGNSLDADVVLFFVLAQALLDASIAAWDAKRAYDTVRPITAIRYYFRGQTIQAWGGVGVGTAWIRGENWMPYQRTTSPSPNFPEFLSGHSTFSAAAAGVIAALRGDRIKLAFPMPQGSIKFDPTVPAKPVTFRWAALSEVAAAAGLSRRLGGIHFERGDLKGRELGGKIANAVIARCAKLVLA